MPSHLTRHATGEYVDMELPRIHAPLEFQCIWKLTCGPLYFIVHITFLKIQTPVIFFAQMKSITIEWKKTQTKGTNWHKDG